LGDRVTLGTALPPAFGKEIVRTSCERAGWLTVFFLLRWRLFSKGRHFFLQMEDTGLWRPWTHDSLEEAVAEVKRRFGLPEVSEHDAFLRDLLQRRLDQRDGQWVWPRGVRSALVYWDV
jgi:hypothetical protein